MLPANSMTTYSYKNYGYFIVYLLIMGVERIFSRGGQQGISQNFFQEGVKSGEI